MTLDLSYFKIKGHLLPMGSSIYVTSYFLQICFGGVYLVHWSHSFVPLSYIPGPKFSRWEISQENREIFWQNENRHCHGFCVILILLGLLQSKSFAVAFFCYRCRKGLFWEFGSFGNGAAGNSIYENTRQYAILKNEWEGNGNETGQIRWDLPR